MKSYSLIILIFAIGLLSKNRLIYISSGVILLFSLLNLLPNTETSRKIVMDVGLVLLVIGVMMPFTTKPFSTSNFYTGLFSLTGSVAFLIGAFSSVMARGGIRLMSDHPEVLIGLLFGTIIGTAFFRGIPVGPLVAAGLVALVVNLIHKIV